MDTTATMASPTAAPAVTQLVALSNLVHIAACCASLYSSGWMLKKMCSVPRSRRHKLLARQLQYLAALNLVSFSLLTPKHVGHFLVFWCGLSHAPGGLFTVFCKLDWLSSIAVMPTAFLDIHIAASMAFTIHRWDFALKILSRILTPFVVLGVLLATVDWVVLEIGVVNMGQHRGNIAWDSTRQDCGTTHLSRLGSRILFATSFGAAFVAALIYALGTCGVISSEALRARLLKRTILFLAGSMLTSFPISIWSFTYQLGHYTPQQRWEYQLIVIPLFLLSGVADTLVYLVLCQQTQSWVRQASSAPRSLRYVSGPMLHKVLNRRAPAAVGVCFGDTEVHGVQPLYAEAQRRAQRDLDSMLLQREKFAQHQESLDASGSSNPIGDQVEQWMIDPIHQSNSGLLVPVRACMDLNSEIIDEKPIGATVCALRPSDSDWLELVGEAGFLYDDGSIPIVMEDKWVLDPDGKSVHSSAVVEKVYDRPSTTSDVLRTKPSGDVVRGFRDRNWLKLSEEPGYIFIKNKNGAPNVARVTWATFAQGLVDTEDTFDALSFAQGMSDSNAAAEELLFGVYDCEDEISVSDSSGIPESQLSMVSVASYLNPGIFLRSPSEAPGGSFNVNG